MAQMVKSLPTMQETGFDPWVGKIPRRRKWQPTPVFLPGESHGQRNLVGYRPRGRKESDTTERLHFFFYVLLTSQFSKSHARSAGTRRRGALHDRGVSLSSHEGSHCSVFQRDGSHRAALAVCHEQAAPGVLCGQRQA